MSKFTAKIEMQNNTASTKLSLRQKLAMLAIVVFCMVLAVIVLAPVKWLNMYLQSQTHGRLALVDEEGSLWNGSARIGAAMDKRDDLALVVPGKFTWHLSPVLLLGQIDLQLVNSEVLQQPLTITGNLRHIQLSPGSIVLPADRLSKLGAPLNTVKPTGQMSLSWDAIGLTHYEGNYDLNGPMKLSMYDIGSALSPIKPLGSFVMSFIWYESQADIVLTTLYGPLLLDGKGKIADGHFQFSGTARAEKEQEENLANLLNLLGQHRPGADKNVIALEFK